MELNDGTVCQRYQDQIRRWHDSVDTAPMLTIIEPPDWDTSVPPATATLPELPSSDEFTMFGSRHIKQYYPEDFICAAVIRSLRRSVADSNSDSEQIIRTISCD